MNLLLAPGIHLAEKRWIPDALIRRGIRGLLRRRASAAAALPREALDVWEREFLERLAASPLAVHQDKANEQHYEVPATFFEHVLGPHRKYSSCFFPTGFEDLEGAERAALDATIERAGLRDGQDVLELGCGWGSLTLAMAARFPASRITALSNSASQRQSILERCAARGLDNVNVLTQDIATFDTSERYDRVVSVEMFEHVRNWPALFERVASWLQPRGEFFLHVFCHRSVSHEFETDGPQHWMGRHFFTGGIMPAFSLAERCGGPLRLAESWRWDGTHYARTAEAWLENLDRCERVVMPILETLYGALARAWFGRWRIFFLACAELFGFDEGREWFVGHYRFVHRGAPRP